jgi:hypothetical protein
MLPTEGDPKWHIQGDILEHINDYWHWDLAIMHPPCTYLASSGARWWKDEGRQAKQDEAIEFFKTLMDAPIPFICCENPVGCLSTRYRKPDQYIQPWMFGHGETKKTGLWLKNLPLLTPTNVVSGREQRLANLPQSKDRWKERSRTFPGIAEAMAMQWGDYVLEALS